MALWRAVSVCDHTLLQAHLQLFYLHTVVLLPMPSWPGLRTPDSPLPGLGRQHMGLRFHSTSSQRKTLGASTLHSHALDHACWRSCQPLGRSLLEPRGPGEESMPRYDGERTIWLLSVLIRVLSPDKSGVSKAPGVGQQVWAGSEILQYSSVHIPLERLKCVKGLDQ